MSESDGEGMKGNLCCALCTLADSPLSFQTDLQYTFLLLGGSVGVPFRSEGSASSFRCVCSAPSSASLILEKRICKWVERQGLTARFRQLFDPIKVGYRLSFLSHDT